MLISGSRVLFESFQPAGARCFACSAARRLRQRSLPAPIPPAESDNVHEAPKLGMKAQQKALRAERLAQLIEDETTKRGKPDEPDTIWISVYLSLGTKKRSGLNGAGCSTYTGMTYDLATALKADNGERKGGVPYEREPGGYRVPIALRPFRMMVAVGGFNSAAAANMFLKAWKHPASARFLRAPDLLPRSFDLDRHGHPIKMATRPNPLPGEQFFHNDAVSSLDYKFAVLQRLCTIHPFDKMPLRVALYNTSAAKLWQDALEGDWPGGPADSLPAVEGWTCPPARLASSDLHRRYPIPDGALDRLRPELRSQSQPWFGPTFTAGDALQTRQLRGADTMIRSLLGTATAADRQKLLTREVRRDGVQDWKATARKDSGAAEILSRIRRPELQAGTRPVQRK